MALLSHRFKPTHTSNIEYLFFLHSFTKQCMAWISSGGFVSFQSPTESYHAGREPETRFQPNRGSVHKLHNLVCRTATMQDCNNPSWLSTYIYTHIYIYMHIYIYTHTHTHKKDQICRPYSFSKHMKVSTEFHIPTAFPLKIRCIPIPNACLYR